MEIAGLQLGVATGPDQRLKVVLPCGLSITDPTP